MKHLSLFNYCNTCYRVNPTVCFNTCRCHLHCQETTKVSRFAQSTGCIEYDWYKIGIALEVKNRVLGSYVGSNDDDTAKVIAVSHSWVDTIVLYTLLLSC